MGGQESLWLDPRPQTLENPNRGRDGILEVLCRGSSKFFQWHEEVVHPKHYGLEFRV